MRRLNDMEIHNLEIRASTAEARVAELEQQLQDEQDTHALVLSHEGHIANLRRRETLER